METLGDVAEVLENQNYQEVIVKKTRHTTKKIEKLHLLLKRSYSFVCTSLKNLCKNAP